MMARIGKPGVLFIACAMMIAGACSSPPEAPLVPPPGFPQPRIPADNPLTTAKIELGRHLFYDARLSGNGTQACASCHQQKLAFTDGLPVGVGSTGQHHIRGAMSLANVVYTSTLTWANPTISALEKQALVPMFGETPVELGLSGMEELLRSRLEKEPQYQTLFAAAYPEQPNPISLDAVVKAIASFERSLVSGRSPYDRFSNDNELTAISDSAKRGKELFFGERLECFHCHGGFAFSDAVVDANTTLDETSYQNNGLYNIGGDGSYPAGNQGIFEFSACQRTRGGSARRRCATSR